MDVLKVFVWLVIIGAVVAVFQRYNNKLVWLAIFIFLGGYAFYMFMRWFNEQGYQ